VWFASQTYVASCLASTSPHTGQDKGEDWARARKVISIKETLGGKVRYWINTVSRAHVQAAVTGGFTQADHGRQTRLKRLQNGDLIAFYSPRTEFKGGEPLQAFTAIGAIADDEPYQVEMRPSFHPWRRRVAFLECAETPIQPLIGDLEFIKDKSRWGFPFRRGLFEIDEADFSRIAEAMKPKHGGIANE
jgi:hypothetical protein